MKRFVLLSAVLLAFSLMSCLELEMKEMPPSPGSVDGDSDVVDSEADDGAADGDTEISGELDQEVVTESEIDPESEIEAELDVEEDSDGDLDPDLEEEIEPEMEPELEPEVEVEAEIEVEAEVEAEIEIEAEVEVEVEIEAEIEVEAEIEIEVEVEAETDGPEPTCPDDMVKVADYCIDRYEASRPDADADSVGSDGSVATSREGVMPWYVNPMNATHLGNFKNACTAAGKHLCTAEEWFPACSGPQGTDYVFGDTWTAGVSNEICNCVDTFCDDYCEDNSIPSGNCNVNTGCGYYCGETGGGSNPCFKPMPTGSFAGCTNEYGTFDINGNVWDIVDVPTTVDARGYQVRGGAFNCAGASTRLKCAYNATWTGLYAGFRCCKSLSE